MNFNFNAIISMFGSWLQFLLWIISDRLKSEVQRELELLALKSQLACFQEKLSNKKITKPTLSIAFRQLWVFLSKFFFKWQDSLILVKPETVVGWHKTAFRIHWKHKSKKRGRPQISPQTIALIKRIHKENPLLSPEKIHERLISLAITDAPAPNTIVKYLPKIRKPPNQKKRQAWKTFLSNHKKDLWAMDFLVVPTITFKLVYVLVLLNHDRRKIEHFAVTNNPTSAWVSQQIREATPYGKHPKYLIHDNDCIFISKAFQEFLVNTQIISKRTSYRSPWQNGICERTIGIIRQELLNHVIPINQKHLESLLKEYVHRYYNPFRTHQGIGGESPIAFKKPHSTLVKNTLLISQPILNGLYHGYKKIS